MIDIRSSRVVGTIIYFKAVKQLNCEYFIGIEKGCKENCGNCKKWTGTICEDEQKIIREYQELKAFDRMMRENKGVMID